MADLINTSTAAEILGVHRATVWRLVESGELPFIALPRTAHRRAGGIFDRADVEALRDHRAQLETAS